MKTEFEIVKQFAISYYYSGWLMSKIIANKGLGSLLGTSMSFKRRYFVLHDHAVECFEDNFSLETPQHQILPGELTEITEKVDKAGKQVLTLHTVTATWDLQWIEGDSSRDNHAWKRKFNFLLPKRAKNSISGGHSSSREKSGK